MKLRPLFFAAGMLAAAACVPSGDRAAGTAAGRMAPPPGMVSVREFGKDGRLMEATAMEKVVKTDAEWRKILTQEQYTVARGKGTEPAFCGVFYDHHQPGIYSCVCCGLPLFSADAKFDSGTGWPSFFQPVAEVNVITQPDNSHGMKRVEILCARCDAHLGHVFDDGPKPTGRRYCLNSVSLVFAPQAAVAVQPKAEKATFAAGCFWGVEETFRALPGVVSTTVGYTGGRAKSPTYKQVCANTTGHAEAIEIVFDPALVTYEKLLAVFWENHDPTTLNRQGPDVGSQYRSAIFFHSDAQKAAALAAIAALTKEKRFPKPIVTELVPVGEFWPAEEYHQKYFMKKGGGSCNVH